MRDLWVSDFGRTRLSDLVYWLSVMIDSSYVGGLGKGL
jgi:hypothetical protein